MREVMNAVRYVLCTSCQWRQQPKDFPPRSTVYGYFWEWSRYGVLDHMRTPIKVAKIDLDRRAGSRQRAKRTQHGIKLK